MKRHIPYIVALAWMMAVAVLAFADGLSWSRERTRSAYLDGCAVGDRIYLVENMERDGILYVMDSQGTVQEVSLASAVEKGSFFARIDYEEALYGLMVKKAAGQDAALQYRIVEFDDQGRVLAKTPEFTLHQPGTLTGFHAEAQGFYLTAVLEGQTSAGAYFVEKEALESEAAGEQEQTKEEAPSVKKPVQMGYSPVEHTLIEARYEDGAFLYHLDDGSGVEDFQAGEKLQGAFWYRSLSMGQIMKVRRERMLLYGALLIVGYGVLWLFLSVLRNRSHTVYAIAVVELALTAVFTLIAVFSADGLDFKALASVGPYFFCFAAIFTMMMINTGSQSLYVPLLLAMGETRRNVLLGFRYYQALILAATTGLCGLIWLLVPGELSSLGLRSLPCILCALVAVSSMGSIMGTLFVRWKWLGTLIIVLLCGGAGGLIGITSATALNGGFNAAEVVKLAGYLVKTPWWLVLIALGTLAADVLFQWVLLRRREVKL